MNFKIAFIICHVIIFGVLGWAVYTKIVQPSEAQKAREIINYNNEPHFGMLSFGCNRYVMPEKK